MSSIVSYHNQYPALFQGRQLHVVSRHQKHLYLTPPIAAATGLIVKPFTEVDTDTLGTFSGEVERTLSPLEAAREKCRLAASFFKEGYLLASEGSFGPHPTLGFVAAGEEWLVLYDLAEKKELIVRDITFDICFHGELITEIEKGIRFLDQVGFPEQKVILKSSQHQPVRIVKDSMNQAEVLYQMEDMVADYGSCFVETDMRAMNNPSRQKHLHKLGEKLAERLSSICAQCGWYGFSVVRVERGLPCSWCGTPTESVLCEVLGCVQCGLEQHRNFPAGKQQEDPQFCNQCNP
jgi:hypothetical protein